MEVAFWTPNQSAEENSVQAPPTGMATLDKTTCFGFSFLFIGSTVVDGSKNCATHLQLHWRVTAITINMKGDDVNGICPKQSMQS